MGYVAHDMLIVTTWRGPKDWPDVDAFRHTLPEDWQRLLVGPIPSVVNGDVTWVFCPDGSKSGWDTDEQGDRYRDEFAALFSAHNYGFDVVRLKYGADMAVEIEQPRAEYVETCFGSAKRSSPERE